jgi:uncharacterized membrane protein YecN with MAPEG domain
MLQSPVTLVTAMILAVIAIGISARSALTRSKQEAMRGSIPIPDLFLHRQCVPKYVECLPALLLLMRLLESAGANRVLLAASSAALVFARILHCVGVARLAPRFCSAAGAIGAAMLVVLCACYGLAIEGQLP